MTWLSRLVETYEQNTDRIGQFERKANDREYALLPLAHTTQTAYIEVMIDEEGQLVDAKVVDKADASTIIPCTEDSASRTSKPVPHPLVDKLMYVAGDYGTYVEQAKLEPHTAYMAQLQAWCDSAYAHPKVDKIRQYLQRGTLIKDLVERGMLWLDARGKLLDKWTDAGADAGDKPEIFKLIAGDQSGVFVRFAVELPGDQEPRLWRDTAVQQAFSQYYADTLDDMELCYVSGKLLPYADKHTSRIRYAADRAKLISSNDSSGFTYRGRFRTRRDAAAISYEASQKAHNALKWLIERQGFTLDGKTFLLWGDKQLDVPDPYADSFNFYDDEEEEDGDSTHRTYANLVGKALAGYRMPGSYQSQVMIMMLDAATTGRLSIVYYRTLDKELFLDRLQYWHETCTWQHRYRKNSQGRFVLFEGAPAVRDIGFATYGPRGNDKLLKGLMERLLPSIIEERAIPLDLVRSAVQRASNPAGMERWEWEKTLSIACALVNKHHKGAYMVSLDTTNTDRSYLFGRMLAVADVLERRAIGREDNRATNALRYMNAFAQRPARTWAIIQANLQPYLMRLRNKGTYYTRLIDEIGATMQTADFHDQSLDGVYLLGFYSQRHELYTKRSEAPDGGAEEVESNGEGEIEA